MQYTGKVSGGLLVHPNKEQLLYALGCAVVIEKIAGKKSQQFLIGDNNGVACVAVSKSGKYVATGVVTHQGYQVLSFFNQCPGTHGCFLLGGHHPVGF